MANVFQELIDQSDAVYDAVADMVEMNDIKRLKCDYAGIASSLIEIMHEKKVCRPNRDYVTKLAKKLKNVAEGHIPLNMVPDFGGEDLNDHSELRKAEEDLVKRLCEEMEVNAKKRKIEKKQYQKEAKKRKRAIDLPFSNPNLRENVDFDRIANMRAEEDNQDEDDALSFGDKMKQKRKAKAKGKSEKQEPKKTKKNSKLGVDVMMSDLVEEPARHEKVVTINAAKESKKRKKSRAEKLEEINQSNKSAEDSTDFAPATKKRRMGITNPLPADDLELLSKFAKKKATSKRTERAKTNKLLLSKLLGDEEEPKPNQAKKSDKKSLESDDTAAKCSKLPKPNLAQPNDVKTEKLAKILGTDMAQAAIVKNAIEASKKPKKLKNPTVKDLQKNEPKSSPKAVSFQMSKNQVQRFRKNDKSLVLSPSPSIIPFDPSRTPDFGLLKKTTPLRKKVGNPKKKNRLRSSGFF